ncbi:MAG: alkyl hydroperoxide reductase AhpD [Planctomycetota bacterium]|nr:MAG: alkyl hydroperoxide reductase AhpD [Planctomycetota bacterium]
MSRIPHIEPAQAEGRAQELLDGVQRQLGMVPNFMKVFANSPATLAGFLGLNGQLHQGTLDAKLRERIALAVAEGNSCQYCVSAHTALGANAGLDEAEIMAARQGRSTDERAAAGVSFALTVLENLGDVTGDELQAARDAGFNEGEIVEIVALVGLNVLTNLVGKVAQIDIDFPEVELLASAQV